MNQRKRRILFLDRDGTLNEEGIVIEEIETLYPFEKNHPLPDNLIRNNNDIVWDWNK